ncbi:entericidin A/B family lipoprotein [Sphingomonadaceae bacterium OTU29MARTA1]|nr:entericidin A/B family lipoprotein [Sphingomonadaceae bacterium OTU29MARTA1]
MNKTIGFAVILTGMISLTACHTVNGAGKDLKSAGSAVSDASGETKK